MIQTIILTILTLVGIWKFPVFTLGCILIHYEHPVLGIIAIIVSIVNHKYEDEEDYEYYD